MNRSATSSEMDSLVVWLSAPENHNVFKKYVRIHYAIAYNLNNPDPTAIKEVLLQKIENDRRVSLRDFLKYAAIIVPLLLFTAYFYWQSFTNDIEPTIVEKNNITLKTSNGAVLVINEGDERQILDRKGKVIGVQKGDKIYYNSEHKIELAFNELTVPYGRHFDLMLSDGTYVKLNSGSTLKYPVSFSKSDSRVVFLEGEAYFDVAQDKENPFMVNSDNLNIRVLGTEFNVMAYPEDEASEVVLVEGSVEMGGPRETVILEPGTKGSFDRKVNTISVTSVDPSVYTSWKNGELVFRNRTFTNILKKLERQYNIPIRNLSDDGLGNERFNARFGKGVTLDEILENFKDSYGIEYQKDENSITVK